MRINGCRGYQPAPLKRAPCFVSTFIAKAPLFLCMYIFDGIRFELLSGTVNLAIP